MSQQVSARTRCAGCNEPGCNCTRMCWTHPPMEGVWLCEHCWAPRDASEERQYRREMAVPADPLFSCSVCGRLPPPEATLAAIIRAGLLKPATRRAANDKPEMEIPKRRAYSFKEAAHLIGFSLTMVKDEVRDRKIATVMAGKRRKILDAEITRYLLTAKPGPKQRR